MPDAAPRSEPPCGAANGDDRLSAPVLTAALALADRGTAVFPCNPANKRPLTERGFKDATTDPTAIHAWWLRYPKAMIGAPSGRAAGFFVIDLDLKGDGLAHFTVLCER